ncbi:MAG: alginate lyase family protein [Chitinophagaceae bacterium]|nr:MAG: alginate lyase family protein [Chitinophagaceae bacterium]
MLQIHWYKKYADSKLSSVHLLSAKKLILSDKKYLGEKVFSFLNIEHQFKEQVDWNYLGHGKLWNYNLQYFDFLFDVHITDTEKACLLNDFSEKLLSGHIPPEPYPVSLRLINWIIYYSETNINSPAFHKALKYQVDYLEHNLEFHIQANHLWENYIALAFSGLALRDETLTVHSLRSVERQLKEQVFADGGHYEGSPMYQSILLAKLLMLLDAWENTDWVTQDNEWLRIGVSKMLGWLDAFSFRNQTWAFLNDATAGIAPQLSVLKDVSAQMHIAATEIKLKESGYRKMENRYFEVLVDIADIQPEYQPGHSHSDMLSFCMQYKGMPVFVDPGISTYQTNSRRMLERSTALHNTVAVNQKNQSEIWSSFRVGKRAKLTIECDSEKRIVAYHNGYLGTEGILHDRTFTLEDTRFNITDCLKGDNPNKQGLASFYLDHTVKLYIEESSGLLQINDDLMMRFSGECSFEIDTYRQALGFNFLENSKVIRVYFSGSLSTSIFAK